MSPQPRVVHEILRHWAIARGADPFVTIAGEFFRFADLDRRAQDVAAGLARLGIDPGDRLAIISPNRAEVVEIYFGAARRGVIQVPLNAYLKDEFLRYQLRDSQPTALVVDADGLEVVLPLVSDIPTLRVLITMDADPHVEHAGIPRLSYAEAFPHGGKAEFIPATPASIMSIMYTSGTTGMPKGCMLTHGYYTRAAAAVIGMLNLAPRDHLYSTLPLFHAGGRLLTLAAALATGCQATIDPTFSAAAILPRCRQVDASVIIGLGAMGSAMLKTPPSDADLDHEVRAMIMVPMAEPDQVRFEQRFGIDPFVEAFGQTECMPVLTGSITGQRNRSSAGRPAHDVEVALLDGDGTPVPVGEVGEICVRPRDRHAMFSGYWNDPSATLRQYEGLWYHTGDQAREMADGSYVFADRKKDSLRRRGENVSSLELEASILRHPRIAEAAVHAIPSDLGEDDIKACLVSADDKPWDAAELFEYFVDVLPYFAVPRYVEFMPTLPRTAVGRVTKHILRERPLQSPDVWDFEQLGYVVARADRRRVRREFTAAQVHGRRETDSVEEL
ncbi:hypothetical protein A5742_14560 [Mycolicibacterium fortuitum]|uniref:ATP-dependent acyl-CoA ligase n=1 Tax=Mycolicibacterium fortuitum TaxID=1766 RepID=A0ABD6QC71_MYCFO|nr:AMP-binding protein [Mycolicibacterium fortuitum]OMC33116.1 hypothetical protein A5742_14560 [Mycolicibacterium fortuitum]